MSDTKYFRKTYLTLVDRQPQEPTQTFTKVKESVFKNRNTTLIQLVRDLNISRKSIRFLFTICTSVSLFRPVCFKTTDFFLKTVNKSKAKKQNSTRECPKSASKTGKDAGLCVLFRMENTLNAIKLILMIIL